jgi:signal transduction histidine kinase
MMGHGLLELLFPRDERDAGFRREMERLSLTGLRTASGIGIGGPLLMVLLGVAGAPGILKIFTLDRMLLALFAALVALAVSFIPGARPHLRLLGVLSGVLIAFEVVLGLMRALPDPVRAAHLANAKVIVVMLVAVAAFPLKPLHALAMGLGITVGLAAAMGTASYPPEDAGLAAIPVVSVFIVTLVCTLLTTVLYRQRASAYWARRAAEESFEELRRAQARLLVSENALSLGRLAAALSHEMNSPLGALQSAVDTLVSLVERNGREPMSDRLEELTAGVSRTARQAFVRLRETVNRIKDFSNLDRAELRVVNLNELWEETVALLESELQGKADVKLDLKPLPPVKCRPQQLTAVFSNLLRNAAEAIESAGTIQISSDQRGADVVLEVRDDGRGIPAERLSRLFEPAFRVQSGRVGTSWGLFVSRSIISEHGGQLEISSAVGRGTTAKIVLPLPLAGAA